MIYSYQKYIDALRTVEIALPTDPTTHQRVGIELATVNGVTYVYLPDTATLPAQPAEITVTTVTLTAATTDAIKSASPHVRLINERVVVKIRDKYSVDEEIKMLRIAPGAETTAYNTYVESCRAWGKAEKAKLGL